MVTFKRWYEEELDKLPVDERNKFLKEQKLFLKKARNYLRVDRSTIIKKSITHYNAILS